MTKTPYSPVKKSQLTIRLDAGDVILDFEDLTLEQMRETLACFKKDNLMVSGQAPAAPLAPPVPPVQTPPPIPPTPQPQPPAPQPQRPVQPPQQPQQQASMFAPQPQQQPQMPPQQPAQPPMPPQIPQQQPPQPQQPAQDLPALLANEVAGEFCNMSADTMRPSDPAGWQAKVTQVLADEFRKNPGYFYDMATSTPEEIKSYDNNIMSFVNQHAEHLYKLA